MCGICGFVDFNKSSSKNILHGMTEKMQLRGPDGSGVEFFENNHYQLGFGHRRLAIIDLSKHGHQPMYSSSKKNIITYNGEIYNHKEIKQELEVLGHKFYSCSDTEVILAAFEEWGLHFIDHFIGMFAFAIYEIEKQKLLLCRDRAGVKPLFYYWNDNIFMFGSELKSLNCHPLFKKEIDHGSLWLYFKYGYIPTPHSIFKHTFKLDPGHWLEFNLKTQELSRTKYWDLWDYYKKPKLKISFSEAKKKLKKLLISACNYRMVSDVPVGVFLSGGYDSTAVAALLQKHSNQPIKTFTIGFEEEKFNEAPYAKETAKYLGTDHYEHYCTSKEAKNLIPQLSLFYDEPFADSSAIPTLLVSKVAKEKVGVVLSADAGDEVFWGYKRYLILARWHNIIFAIPRVLRLLILTVMEKICRIGALVHKRFLRRAHLLKILNSSNKNIDELFIAEMLSGVEDSFVNKILTTTTRKITRFNQNSSLPFLEKMQLVDYQTYLVEDILVKVDRATMAVSLEGREPMLDHRIAEFAAQLPMTYKFDRKTTKKILKEIVHDYVPKALLERPKKGFSVPIYKWLRTDLQFLIEEHLGKDFIEKQGIFKTKEIELIKRKFLNGESYYDSTIWKILMFQMWYKKWMNDGKASRLEKE